MSLGSGREESAREEGNRARDWLDAGEDVVMEEREEMVDELWGMGFLDNFFGILARL